MDKNKREKFTSRRTRHQRIRRRLSGTPGTPRLSVFRSNKAIYAQLIDDVAGHTLAAASSLEDGIARGDDGKVGEARQVGTLIAERAQAAGVTDVVFDRGGNRYAGRVAALAEGARDAGLNF